MSLGIEEEGKGRRRDKDEETSLEIRKGGTSCGWSTLRHRERTSAESTWVDEVRLGEGGAREDTEH